GRFRGKTAKARRLMLAARSTLSILAPSPGLSGTCTLKYCAVRTESTAPPPPSSAVGVMVMEVMSWGPEGGGYSIPQALVASTRRMRSPSRKPRGHSHHVLASEDWQASSSWLVLRSVTSLACRAPCEPAPPA